MDYIVSNTLPLLVIGGTIAGYAVYANGGCSNKKAKKTSSVVQTDGSTYDEMTKQKDKKKKGVVADKKDVTVDATLYKSAAGEPSDDEVVVKGKGKKGNVVVASAKKPEPVKKVVEETKKAEESKKVEEPKVIEKPVEKVVDPKDAEIARLRAMISSANEKKKVEAVDNPAPKLSATELAEQRAEEERLSAEYSAQWNVVPVKNVRAKKATVAEDGAAGTPEEPKVAKVIPDVLDVQVPVDKRGVVMGKGGETMKRIQELTGVKIDMPKSDSKATKVVLEGTKDGVTTAKAIISDLVKKGYSSHLTPELTDSIVNVPVDKRAQVLGSKGANIAKISATTNVKVNFPEKTSSSSEVVLVGDEAGVAIAKSAIQKLVKDGFSPLTHEGWSKLSVRFPFAYRKNLIGIKGTVIKSIQNTTGCQITLPENDDEHVVVVGPAAQTYNAEASIRKIQERLDNPVEDTVADGFDDEVVIDNEEW